MSCNAFEDNCWHGGYSEERPAGGAVQLLSGEPVTVPGNIEPNGNLSSPRSARCSHVLSCFVDMPTTMCTESLM